MDTDEKIRLAVLAELARKRKTQTALANELGIKLQSVNDIVRRKSGLIPSSLETLLDALDLELVVQPKGRRE